MQLNIKITKQVKKKSVRGPKMKLWAYFVAFLFSCFYLVPIEANWSKAIAIRNCTYSLTIIHDIHATFAHLGMHFSPRFTFISRKVDCSFVREHDVDIEAGFTTPNDIIDPAVYFKDLEVCLKN